MVWPTGITSPSLRLHAGENAFGGRFDFDHGLIGFDFEQRLALGDAFAFFFPPGR